VLLCFHTDFCIAGPARLDVDLALHLPLLIMVTEGKGSGSCAHTDICKSWHLCTGIIIIIIMRTFV